MLFASISRPLHFKWISDAAGIAMVRRPTGGQAFLLQGTAETSSGERNPTATKLLDFTRKPTFLQLPKIQIPVSRLNRKIVHVVERSHEQTRIGINLRHGQNSRWGRNRHPSR
jgi:hypothetical protein